MIVSLKLAGKSVVVVGSTDEARNRSRALVREGANVTLIACARRSFTVEPVDGVIEIIRRRLQIKDFRNAFLVVATDRDPEVNVWLYEKSTKMRFLLNTLDEAGTSNFYHTSVRSVGESVELAVSTDGRSPAFASRLSSRLARLVDDEDLRVLSAFTSTRKLLKDKRLSTFDFDWDLLEQRVRDGASTFEPLSLPELATTEKCTIEAKQQRESQDWPLSPFTNNFLRQANR